MTRTTLDSWEELEIRDLFYAYRKAKADCFFERSLFIAREFAEFERDLPLKLHELLGSVRQRGVGATLQSLLGEVRLSAKKLGTKPKKASVINKAAQAGHGYFSDPKRAFRHLHTNCDLEPEFRLVGDFPIAMHVMSALWINLVGHKFDAVLSSAAYGSRLRRYRPAAGAPAGALGGYHTESIGSFQPYFNPYKQWRERGLQAIRDELAMDGAVIAITMDLTSYYHRIDPAFMADEKFWTYAGIKLTDWEKDFTREFASALAAWSNLARERLLLFGCKAEDVAVGGLPIGLSISRVLSNALLVGLDREIERQLSPVYYGRYVDDIFLVIRDPKTVRSVPEILKFIHQRTKCFPPRAKGKDGSIWLTLPDGYQGKTTLLLQQAKQKVFYLEGRGGVDLLDSIVSQIRSVSSERRLMPSPDNLETMAAAKVLTAAGQAAEEADTLRRADGLSIRRLGWSVLLRAVETLARDLRQDDWKIERDRFYHFALDHVLRADKIFDHLDYLPRLLSLAVALMDWPMAKRLSDASFASLDALEAEAKAGVFKVNGFKASNGLSSAWVEIRRQVSRSAADAIIRSLRWTQRNGGPRRISETGLELCSSVDLAETEEQLYELSREIRECDLARVPYKDHVRRDALRQRPYVNGEDALVASYEHSSDLIDFIDRSLPATPLSVVRVNHRCLESGSKLGSVISMIPYICPTRPYTTHEISLYLPEDCVFAKEYEDRRIPARNWARYVRAVRGVWVLESLVSEDVDGSNEVKNSDGGGQIKMARLDGKPTDQSIFLGISSLRTTEDSWRQAAQGRSDLSRKRYEAIKTLVDQVVHTYPRPTHLLLPELSLPDRWLTTVTGLLRDSGVSLIAGLDYCHKNSPSSIHSEAALVLADDRLGFPSYVQIHQPKLMPAPREEKDLLEAFGKEWTKFDDHHKPVYVHKGFAFGVLVCSELQNMEHRQSFQGAVDCVMVLSWNQDLETFSSLVESASLDVHAFVALVNNRKYGDSRVRTPAKENFRRDLCRLRGGENEHVVVVRVEYQPLRAFQSRAKRWPEENDPYKPVPEGYEIKGYRKTIPS